MFNRFKYVALGAATAALVFAGLTGATAAFGSTHHAAQLQQQAPIVSTGLVLPEMHFVPLDACRLVDTRIAGGPLGNNVSRNFHARGSGSLASQGGNSHGCGIPHDASAIAVNIGAVNPTGPGYLKAKAYGASGSGGGAANYATGQNVGGYLILNLGAPNAAFAFTVTNSGGPTGVIVDVTGYYIQPIWAHISSSGLLVQATNRYVSSTHLGTGNYQVDFDRDVSKCSYAANSFNFGLIAEVEPRTAHPDAVFVEFSNTSGADTDSAFYLTVTC